ncbi:hypothetical protein VBD025_04730 [Virgibacillus flavescens]|uniref:hypothetical protein n=1 Tax=Virgibacillus flavescens TaxID=1611422 RepID=UPI003D334319
MAREFGAVLRDSTDAMRESGGAMRDFTHASRELGATTIDSTHIPRDFSLQLLIFVIIFKSYGKRLFSFKSSVSKVSPERPYT